MKRLSFLIFAVIAAALSVAANAQSMKLNDLGYFEARGTNVLVYNNIYNGGFYDEKFAGLEIIQRGNRIATGGGVRLMNTPEQWDIFGVVSPRRIDEKEQSVEVTLTYEDYDFAPRLKVLPKDKGVIIQIWLDKPVPQQLVGKAGMKTSSSSPPLSSATTTSLTARPGSFPRTRCMTLKCIPYQRRSPSISENQPLTTADAATSSFPSQCLLATRSCWLPRTTPFA